MGVAEVVTGIERGWPVSKSDERRRLEGLLGSWAYQEQQAYASYQALPVNASREARHESRELWHAALVGRSRAYADLVKHLKGTPPPVWNEKWEPGGR